MRKPQRKKRTKPQEECLCERKSAQERCAHWKGGRTRQSRHQCILPGRCGRDLRKTASGARPRRLRRERTEPVTGLVGESLALVIVGGRSTGEGRVENDDTCERTRVRTRCEESLRRRTIILRVSRVARRECRVAEQALARSSLEPDGVDVERGSASAAKRLLHSEIGRAHV